MPELAHLVDEVASTLAGHADTPARGALVADVTSSALELAVDFGGNPFIRPAGTVEVGRELMAVKAFDPQTGRVTLFPWGRGDRGTKAVTHDAGDMVTVAPRWPRQRIVEALNQALASALPDVYAVRDLDPIVTGDQVDLGYALPADTLRVLRVEAVTDGPYPERRVVKDWRVRTVAGAKQLEVGGWEAWSTLTVTIAAVPAPLVNDTDDFVETTGMTESCTELAIFGACSRLILAGEAARVQSTTPEADARADKVQAGSATALARFYQALYQQRLQTEQARLQQQYPLTLLRRG